MTIEKLKLEHIHFSPNRGYAPACCFVAIPDAKPLTLLLELLSKQGDGTISRFDKKRNDFRRRMEMTVYKICPETLWRQAEKTGVFHGAPIDLSDGFIHFSTASQLHETAAKHFAGQTGLVLIAVDAEKLGSALKYEVSRGGALFPHLYAPLDLTAVRWVKPLVLTMSGVHQFPDLEK